MVRKELKWYLALCMALLLLASCGRSGTGDETTGTSGPAYSSSEEASSEEERTDPSVTESSDAGSTPADPSVPSASAEDSLSDYPVEGMGFSISLPEGYRLLRISGAYRDGTGKPVLLDYVDEYVAVSGEITPQELADQLEDCPEDPSRGSGAYRIPDCVVWHFCIMDIEKMPYENGFVPVLPLSGEYRFAGDKVCALGGYYPYDKAKEGVWQACVEAVLAATEGYDIQYVYDSALYEDTAVYLYQNAVAAQPVFARQRAEGYSIFDAEWQEAYRWAVEELRKNPESYAYGGITFVITPTQQEMALLPDELQDYERNMLNGWYLDDGADVLRAFVYANLRMTDDPVELKDLVIALRDTAEGHRLYQAYRNEEDGGVLRRSEMIAQEAGCDYLSEFDWEAICLDGKKTD